MVKRRIFQWFTFSLMLLTALMAYMNVVSDDTAVRELAKKTATDAAGCGAHCRMSGFRGDRGMVHETIEYDFDPQGHYVIKCHRQMIALGDYTCVVAEGKTDGLPSSSASAPAATPRPSH